jgi:S-layer homology domain
MFPAKRPAVFLTFIALLTSLTACANSPNARNLEQSVAADPQLQNNPASLGQPVTNNSPQPTTQVQLPGDFPSEIPRYPDATLQEITQQDNAQVTRWTSGDPVNLIQSFYQKQFQDNNWEYSQPTAEGDTLVARRNDLQVTLKIQPAQPNLAAPTPNSSTPTPTSNAATEFTIEYSRNSQTSAQSTPETTATPTVSPQSTAAATQPTPNPVPNATPQVFADINSAPTELRAYITDLAALGILTPSPSATKTNTNSNQFGANNIISRRDFARWLVAANNRMYANNPAKQIRLATAASQPAFQDVPRNHPDFSAIQGLAEAGLIPSPLSGDSTAVLFRPDAPLTREQMILWKVPLDTRSALPNATVDAVKQTWGFQDVGKIDPKALRAILADFQNADASNIRRVYGFTTLFQPKKPATRAEAAGTIWYFGTQGEGVSAKESLQVKQ